MSTSTQSRRKVRPLLIVSIIMLAVLLLSVMLGVKSTGSHAAPQPPAEVMNTASRPDAGQPCNYLDYEGDPVAPDRIILWCDAGQTALVINTRGMKAGDPDDPSDTSGGHDLDVRAGEHYAWHLTMVQQDDGGIDFRVWYDDQKETKDPDGESVMTESRVTMRNFLTEHLAETRSLGYN